MQAILDLKLRLSQVAPIHEAKPVETNGRLSRINRAISKFVTFQNDERLIQMDSPYRWFQ